MTRCESCRSAYRRDTEAMCENCRHRRRCGAIVQAIWSEASDAGIVADMLDGLEALAELMIDRHRVRRAHNRELIDEQRSAQRDARGAFDDGVATGRHELIP